MPGQPGAQLMRGVGGEATFRFEHAVDAVRAQAKRP